MTKFRTALKEATLGTLGIIGLILILCVFLFVGIELAKAGFFWLIIVEFLSLIFLILLFCAYFFD